MERTLKHPERGVNKISREGDVVAVYGPSSEVLDAKVFRTELTAKSYETFLLHYHADLGYKPYG